MKNLQALGLSDIASSSDLVVGDQLINMILLAQIFNKKHGLQELTKEGMDVANELAQMIEDDVEGSREERAFRQWINSLGIEDVFVNNLYEDLRDGLVLLKVIHKISPTLVHWEKVIKKPRNIFDAGYNCELALNAAK